MILYTLYPRLPWLALLLESFWCYQLLATRSLKDESMRVYDRLKYGTLEEARKAVSMIVGRDTAALTEEGVTKAAVETVGGKCFGWCHRTDALYGNRRCASDVSL